MRNIGVADVGSVEMYHASPAAETASNPSATEASRRRSRRSASVPLTRTSSSEGRNSTSPRMPSASSLSVRSKTTLPSTVVSASAPTDEHVCAERNRQTDPQPSFDSFGLDSFGLDSFRLFGAASPVTAARYRPAEGWLGDVRCETLGVGPIL